MDYWIRIFVHSSRTYFDRTSVGFSSNGPRIPKNDENLGNHEHNHGRSQLPPDYPFSLDLQRLSRLRCRDLATDLKQDESVILRFQSATTFREPWLRKDSR